MTEFNYHGWNDLKKVDLPKGELFRVEVTERTGEGPEMKITVFRYVGKTDRLGNLTVNYVNQWRALSMSDDIATRIRLWEED